METKKLQRFFKRLNLLLILTSLTFATSWLPFIRGISDGESYQWGTTFFGKLFYGSGTGGDFYYVLLNVAIGLGLMYTFYWGRRRNMFYLLLIIWYGSMIANSFYEVFLGEGYMFHGDTLNVHLDLSFIIIPFMIVMGALVVKVIIEDRKHSFCSQSNQKEQILGNPIVGAYPRTGGSLLYG